MPSGQKQSLPAGTAQHIRLACQACQRKKIKCDRTFPCGQCVRSALTCEASTRKPRARHAGRRAVDAELRSRITKLEGLVESLSGEVGLMEQDASAPPGTPGAGNAPMSPTTPFWSTLTNEVQALRDTLEADASDEEPDPVLPTDPGAPGPSTHQDSHDLVICPSGSLFVMPGALPEPAPAMAAELYQLYLENVDPVFKVLHRPSIEPFLHRGHPYLGLDANSPPNRALKAAMWFAAVTTLRDDECASRFPMSRADLLRLYRRHIDVALTRADLIVTTDMATLQAFVVYIAASRITDAGRRPWTLTGLIMRLAQGMNLHHEDASHTPYQKEMRRRLWHQIRVLDAFAASDRGSEVLIALASFTTRLPENVDDTDFDETSVSIPVRSGMSDMTFNLMAHRATTLTMRLLTPEYTPKGETWQQRLDLARDLGKELRERYLQFCDMSKPFDRFIHAVGTSMAASSMLRAVRPLQKHVSSTPPRVDSPFVLELAVDSLRASEATNEDPEASKWRWMVWVQWHALAVALAGLCSIRDTPLADMAWMHVDRSFERHSKQVADSRHGKLWRPVERLYRTAKAFRQGGADSRAHHAAPPSTSTTLPVHGPSAAAAPTTILPHAYPNPPARVDPPAPPLPAHIGEPFALPADPAWPATPAPGADLNWMDWENIMQEISMAPGAMDFDEDGVLPPAGVDHLPDPRATTTTSGDGHSSVHPFYHAPGVDVFLQ